MPTYTVWSLDAWGHAPSECVEYGCPCVKKRETETACEEHIHTFDETCEACIDERADEHDDDRCNCHYEVNDRCRVGVIETPDGEDETLLRALQESGYLKPALTLASVEFDDPACMGGQIYVQNARTGKPVFELERDDE